MVLALRTFRNADHADRADELLAGAILTKCAVNRVPRRGA